MLLINLDNLAINNIKLLNNIYKKKKLSFIKILEKFKTNDDEKLNLISPTLSKDINYSLLYYGLCQIYLIKKIKNQNKYQKIKIQTSNFFLYKNIKKNFINQNIYCDYTGNYFDIIKFYLKIFNRFLFLLNFIFWQILNKSQQRLEKYKKIKNINILDTTFLNSCFNNGKFKDRFYENFLKKTKKNYFLCPENLLFSKTRKSIRIIEKQKINVLYRFDFMHFIDYLNALRIVFFPKLEFANKNCEFDLSELVHRDYYNSLGNFNFFMGVLNFYFFKRAQKINIDIKEITNLYENQPAGKGFIYGAKNYFPKSKVIGNLDYFFNFNFGFSHQPLKNEVINKFIPNENYIVTKYYRPLFLKFYKLLKTKVYSFRYSSKDFFNKIKINKIKKNCNILFITSIQTKETIKIINELSKLNLDNRFNIFLKFHPNFDKNFIDKFRFLKSKNIYIANGKIKNLIKDMHISIIGSSSSAVESIFFKTPVICPLNSFFIIDTPLEGLISKDLYKIYYSQNDLKKKIEFYYYLLSDSKKVNNLNKIFFKNKQKILNN